MAQTNERNSPHAISDAAALTHIIKLFTNVGILSLPMVVKNAGLILGPCFLLLTAVVCTHCMQLLVQCSQHLSKIEGVSSMDYTTVMKTAVKHCPFHSLRKHSTKAARLVDIFLMLTQLGFCCIYFVFIATNLRQVVKIYWLAAPDQRAFIAVICVPILFLAFIPHLKVLAWTSIVANVTIVASLGIIFFYAAQDLRYANDLPFAAGARSVPMFFGGAIFAFEGIGLVLPIENKMRNPAHFPRVLNFGMFLVTLLSVSVGVIGYMKYGDKICGSITLNLPFNERPAEAAKILLSFAVSMSWLLQFYVPMQLLDPWLQTLNHKKAVEAVVRIGLTLFVCASAVAIPNLGDYIALIGAFLSTMLALIFPPIIQVLTFHSPLDDEQEPLLCSELFEPERSGLTLWQLAKNFLIVFVGFAGFLAGTIVSIITIIHDLSNADDNDICSGGPGANGTTTPQPILNADSHFNHTLSF